MEEQFISNYDYMTDAEATQRANMDLTAYRDHVRRGYLRYTGGNRSDVRFANIDPVSDDRRVSGIIQNRMSTRLRPGQRSAPLPTPVLVQRPVAAPVPIPALRPVRRVLVRRLVQRPIVQSVYGGGEYHNVIVGHEYVEEDVIEDVVEDVVGDVVEDVGGVVEVEDESNRVDVPRTLNLTGNFAWSKGNLNHAEGSCIICFEDFKRGNMVVFHKPHELADAHYFHARCLKEWWRTKNGIKKCPIDRMNFGKKGIKNSRKGSRKGRKCSRKIRIRV